MAEQLIFGPVSWPLSDGSPNQILGTDGSGNAIWRTPVRPESYEIIGPLSAGHYPIYRNAHAGTISEVRVQSRDGTADLALIRNLDFDTLTGGETIMTLTVSPTSQTVPLDLTLAQHDNLVWRITNTADLDSLYFSFLVAWS